MPIELGSFSLGAIASGIVCSVVTHYLTKSRNTENRRIKEFNEAASKFRTAFKNELLALNPALSRSTADTAEILEGAFDKHRLAVFDFRPFLSSKSVHGFDKAWNEYYRYDNATDGIIHGLNKYSGVGHGYEEKKRLRLLAAKRIEKLLYFANHK
jgi:hypothetical protein